MHNLVNTYDKTWDQIYGSGQMLNRYPWDIVVSFLMRRRARNGERLRVLEVGCGAGSNLWFAAREGFEVYGLDGSKDAIAYAKQRFAAEGLSGTFCVGDFTTLPYNDNFFDLVLDRGALVCCSRSACDRAISEILRVCKPQGHFLYNPYSREDTSASSGEEIADQLRINITEGPLANAGQLCFYNAEELATQIDRTQWTILEQDHRTHTNAVNNETNAYWIIVLEKREDTP